MRGLRALTTLGCLWLAGCSFIVGGAPPECMPGTGDCRVLNDIEGIAQSACELYQCSTQTRTCELSIRDQDGDGLIAPECADLSSLPVDCNDMQAGGEEICNGLDDDCDGIIDESATPAMPSQLMSIPHEMVSYSASIGALAVAHGGARNNASFGLIDGETITGPNTLSSLRAGDLTSTSSSVLEEGCNRRRSTGAPQNVNCSYDDIGLGLSETRVLTAYINTEACTKGQLRLGYFDRTDSGSPAIIERGPLRRSNSFLGIDTDPTLAADGQCTGSSRSPQVFGAARPSVAVQDNDEALVAYLADAVTRPECGGDEVDVEVLAMFVQTDAMGSPYSWVTASNEGTPQSVGRTLGGGRPAVASLGGQGYLVGFADPAGGVKLVAVQMPTPPPPYTRGDALDRAGLETAALTFADIGVIPGGAADDVVLSLGSARLGGRDLGVAWREGCGTGAESIQFRQVFLSNDMTIDSDASHATVALVEGGDFGPPALVYTFAGLLQVGIARPDGRPTGEAANDGGWVVAWQDDTNQLDGPGDDTRISVARISEADGAVLGTPDVVHALEDHRFERPVLYRTDADEVRIAFIERGDEFTGLSGGSLTCLPMSTP